MSPQKGISLSKHTQDEQKMLLMTNTKWESPHMQLHDLQLKVVSLVSMYF